MPADLERLRQAIYREWARLHHNASLRGHLPSFRNQFEEHIFWEAMGYEASLLCEHLSEYLMETYGWRLTFHSYGRSGATIAPEEWMSPSPCGSFGSIREEVLDGDNQDLAVVLRVLEEINAYCRHQAENCAEQWLELKSINDWQEDINEHDGMHLETREVRVPDKEMAYAAV